MAESSIAIAIAARPYPGEVVNGDACRVDWDGDICRIVVIDGLGHGAHAAAAAAAATSALVVHSVLDPVTAIQGCHEALKGTRGAALLMIRIAIETGELTFAGVGNVEAQLWQDGRTKHLVSDRGIVGATLPRIRPVTISLEADWRLLMYTDGIRNRFDLATLQQSAPEADGLAHMLLNDWSRATDDATILVAQPH